MGSPAVTTQEHYKFWETDGTTAVAAVDTAPSLEVDTTYVLSIEIENTGNTVEGSVPYEFQYQLNTGGWVNITASSSAVKTANPTGITDGTATTSGDNLASALTFQAGEEVEDGISAAMALGIDNYTVFRYGFTIDSANVTNADTLEFRITFNGYTTLDGYNVAITSTVSAAMVYSLPLENGAFTLSGTDVSLYYAKSEWDREVRDKEVVTAVVRTSDTVVTITLTAAAGYDISSQEVVTATIPNAALVTSGSDLSVTPTFTIDVAAANPTLTLENGVFTLSGTAVDLLVGKALNLESEAFSISGTAVDLLVGKALSLESGGLTLSGTAVDLLVGKTLALEAGAITLSGTDVTLTKSGGDVTLALESGGLTLSGTAVDLLVGKAVTLESEALTLSGTAVDLLVDKVVTLASGSLTLSGTAVDLLVGKTVTLESGGLTLSGTDVTLTKAGGDATLALEAGTFSLSGTAATLVTERLLNLEAGSLALGGGANTLTVGRTLSLASGSLTLSGTDITVLTERLLNLESGGFSLSGTDVTLVKSTPLSLESGSFAVAGTAVTLVVDRSLTLASGSLTLSGTDVTLTVATTSVDFITGTGAFILSHNGQYYSTGGV